MRKFAVIVTSCLLAVLPPRVSYAQATHSEAPHRYHAKAHTPTRSYNSEMRRRHNLSKERARAGADHVRSMRTQ